ncbi:galactokinase [Hellea balneolensis]|uniref:galactokinase n=1 Tax=Hellea balneolensis TaxID=287478 RepID=UPI000419B828|nr:galactokinase [Hellea balneolensis]
MIEERFEAIFSAAPAISGFTPGRVNLIGEHTDYNGGMVLPTALPLGISLALSPRTDGEIHIWSDKFDDIAIRSLSDKASDHWSDYIVGAVILAREQGYLQNGLNVAARTTLPFGAGISSSAAVTVGILKLARDLAKDKTSDKDIAVLARRVENEFIGMPCGIMDQMAVAIASPGQALALNTETLGYELVDLPTDYHMAVIHSGQFRQLNEGRYKERKEECDAVKAALGHDNICQISDAEFASLSSLPDVLQRRARHCMTDHRRTIDAIACLKDKGFTKLGKLMNESHISMRDDFEITVPKVDRLVEDAVKLGALGARQTGGGFGGCIVACISNDKLKTWKNELLSSHPESFWVS